MYIPSQSWWHLLISPAPLERLRQEDDKLEAILKPVSKEKEKKKQNLNLEMRSQKWAPQSRAALLPSF